MGCSNYKEEESEGINNEKFMPEEKEDTDIYKIKPIINKNSNENSNINTNSIPNINSNTKSNIRSNNLNINENKNKNKELKVENKNKPIVITKDTKNNINKINNRINFVLEIKRGNFDKKDYLENKI